jgi:hypothetical protein
MINAPIRECAVALKVFRTDPHSWKVHFHNLIKSIFFIKNYNISNNNNFIWFMLFLFIQIKTMHSVSYDYQLSAHNCCSDVSRQGTGGW